ncbi:nucleotidyltransferase domain-containing protein [Nocardioides sp. Soil796]|uniref:nucleotidyltransferase domain-containing protein n=1 Tax=Nocardioides sp. Soil796 TaxID=1736412 RepID=UPI00070B1CEE|nr:hypothetical protein [Nocardioides sp. Soil796]KRF15708.1 hypothetical protein ASH02_03425 [Nocardioides sp. Soil796]
MADLTEDEEEIEFQRLYGAWDSLDPAETVEFLRDFEAPWWVVGGWAIEAFTGVPRPHEDIDVVIFARDLPKLLDVVRGRYHAWGAGAGAIRPVNDTWPELHEGASQVWLREHATAPWIMDCILSEDHEGQWVSRRDPAWHAPLDDVTWVAADGIRYLRPEVVLQHKARLDRSKDLRDLVAAWPLLGENERAWLRDAVRREDAEHRWLGVI